MSAEDLEPPAVERESVALGILYGCLACLMWGASPIVLRFTVQHDLPAGDIVAVRFGVAGLLLLPLVLRHGTAGLGWWRSLILACGAGAPATLINVVGLSIAPADHSGVIGPSSVLLFSALGAWLLLGERPGSMRLAGLAVVLLGVGLIGWESLTNLGVETLEGDLLFVLGGVLWAGYTVASRAWAVEPIHATALVAVISMVIYLPLYLIFGAPTLHEAQIVEILMIAGVEGVLSSILALLFYTRAVKILGAGRGAVFLALLPGLVVVMAIPTLGEIPTWLELVGVATVSLGMIGALGLLELRRAS
ncbi:MAG: DMT family transporter [Pseudomonadota bacterium]